MRRHLWRNEKETRRRPNRPSRLVATHSNVLSSLIFFFLTFLFSNLFFKLLPPRSPLPTLFHTFPTFFHLCLFTKMENKKEKKKTFVFAIRRFLSFSQFRITETNFSISFKLSFFLLKNSSGKIFWQDVAPRLSRRDLRSCVISQRIVRRSCSLASTTWKRLFTTATGIFHFWRLTLTLFPSILLFPLHWLPTTSFSFPNSRFRLLSFFFFFQINSFGIFSGYIPQAQAIIWNLWRVPCSGNFFSYFFLLLRIFRWVFQYQNTEMLFFF